MSRISDLAGFTTALSTTQDLSVGVITATSFSGDGSGLTGVASTDNIQTATDAKFLANVNITGITTASSFVGDLTGDVTGNVSGSSGSATGNAGGLTGTPDITVNNITGAALTATSAQFTGNVTIGGTLTYQDVEHIDSVGIITAQQGIQVLANGLDITGIGTFEDRITYDGSLGQSGGAQVDYAVTVASKDSTHRYNGSGSSNGYVIDNLQAPVLTLTPGRSYFFDQSDSTNSSHPLRFYLDADKTTQYTTNVTAGSISAGTAGAGVTIVVGDSTPNVLHYQCSSHGYMGNSAINQSNISGGANAAATFTVDTAGSERFRITSTGGAHFNNAELIERVNITAGKLSGNQNINLENGMAHLFTTTETTTATPNIMTNTGINTHMAVGDVISVNIITTAAAAGYAATVHIDGVTVGTNGGSLVWNGGSAPSEGGSSGNDFYTYSIIKTASATYTVLANVANFA